MGSGWRAKGCGWWRKCGWKLTAWLLSDGRVRLGLGVNEGLLTRVAVGRADRQPALAHGCQVLSENVSRAPTVLPRLRVAKFIAFTLTAKRQE